jgi:hypothetical protein
MIDSIPEPTSSDNTRTSRAVVVNCSGLLSKVLIRDTIMNAPQLALIPEVQDALGNDRVQFFQNIRGLSADGKTGTFANSQPEEAIKWILNNTPSTNLDVYSVTGTNLTVKSFMGKIGDTDLDGIHLYDFHFLNNEALFDANLSKYSGTILNYILACLDQDFYELFFETTNLSNGQPVNRMTIRTKPFTYQDVNTGDDNWFCWESLGSYSIDRTKVLNENLAQSDFEVKNVFQTYFQKALVASAQSATSKWGLQFPIINAESIKKFGLRELTMQSTIANFDKYMAEFNESQGKGEGVRLESTKGGQDMITYLLEKRDKGMEWYGFPNFESGQIICIGADYEIGKRLLFKDKIYYDEEEDQEYTGVEYYIEETTDTLQMGGDYRTTLSLSRGAPPDFVPNWFANNMSKFIKVNWLTDGVKEQVSIDPKKIIDDRAGILASTELTKIEDLTA